MTGQLDLLMFLALVVVIMSGFPVAFSIAGVAVLFACLGWLTGAMDISLLGAFGQRVFGLISNLVLIAIPLFVFMGALLEKSRIAEELLDTMGRAFGQLRGGLGISVILVGTLLAASTGIVGATVVAMGMIALPTMLRAGYDPRVSSGIVCTAGTLGQIIPPSTLLIILADVMSNAYQQAQYEQGKFSVEALSVGQFFAAALVPGLVLVLLYLVYVLFRGALRPHDMPPTDSSQSRPVRVDILAAIVPPILLIFAVLGSILGGIATPTEAAAVGAVGALLMSGARLDRHRCVIMIAAGAFILLAMLAGMFPVRLQRDDLSVGSYALGGGYIALAAGMFSLVFIGLGGEERVTHWLENLPGGPTGALLVTMLIIFFMGFFLDFVEISVIVLPLVTPSLILLGHDPVWLGIMFAINLQTSFLTPPFGFSLFYLRGAAPDEITTSQIYLGVLPFIALQAIGVALIWSLPSLATWLPKMMF